MSSLQSALFRESKASPSASKGALLWPSDDWKRCVCQGCMMRCAAGSLRAYFVGSTPLWTQLILASRKRVCWSCARSLAPSLCMGAALCTWQTLQLQSETAPPLLSGKEPRLLFLHSQHSSLPPNGVIEAAVHQHSQVARLPHRPWKLSSGPLQLSGCFAPVPLDASLLVGSSRGEDEHNSSPQAGCA